MITTQSFLNRLNIKTWGHCPAEVASISTDSRSVSAGDAFIALKGERFNGELFVDDVLQKGASVVVVEESYSSSDIEARIKKYPDTAFITTSDTLKFYQEAARLHLQQWRERKKGRKVKNGPHGTADFL